MMQPALANLSLTNRWPLVLLVLVGLAAVAIWRLTDSGLAHRTRALVLRFLTLAMVCLALTEPLLASNADATTTIFVVDQSTSVTANGDTTADNWLTNALHSASDSDGAAIITFGGSAELTVPNRAASDVPADWTDAVAPDQIDTDFTNIESAVALARTLPVGGNRRIVLISDGGENLGTVQTQASQAAADGIPVDVVIVPAATEDDLRIDSLTLPAAIWQGEQPNVLVSVSTVAAGPALLNLLVDGEVVDQQSVSIPAGLSTYSFTLPVLAAGFHAISLSASADASMDLVLANNEAQAALIVRDAPNVLLVASADTDSANLQKALETGGATVTLSTPGRLPSQLSLLSGYDAFVLDNIPASALEVEQIAALQQATKTLGKGLIVVGGTSSYGPGQYAGTRLEELLPVTVKVTNGRERQKVALLLVVDHSGSMAYDPLNETSKIDMAREAMRLAGTALAVGDTIGVLEFSDSQNWVFPLTQIEGPATIDALDTAISQIKASGGTEMYPALQVGLDAIRNVQADVRHVVLLSDGKSRSGTEDAFLKLVSEAGQDRTTVSTIAIGNDSDQELMEKIAQAGGGRYRFTVKAEEIPALTLEEAQNAGAESVIRGAFQAVQTLPSPIMTGITPDQLPALEGYDFAEAKPDAQVVLVSHRSDPVLAKWQYGLGRVVAWTPDDGADLASGWSSWDQFGVFWSNMLRWTLPDPERNPVQVAVQRDGPDLVLSLTTAADQGSTDYVDLIGMLATISDVAGPIVTDVRPVQTGAGEFQIRVQAGDPGAYELQLYSPGGDATGKPIGFVLPQSPELVPASGGEALMESIAAVTGGTVLPLDDPAAAFRQASVGAAAVQIYRPIWWWFAVAALVFFLLDLMTRLRGWERFAALRRR